MPPLRPLGSPGLHAHVAGRAASALPRLPFARPRKLLGIALVALLGLAAGCTQGDPPPTPTPATTPAGAAPPVASIAATPIAATPIAATPIAATPIAATLVPAQRNPAAGQVAVAIKQFSYLPGSIDVKAGTSITWTNGDAIVHSVTQGTPEQPGRAFDSGLFDEGQVFSFTFQEPGVYAYFCTRHTFMRGEVRVTA